MSGIDLNRNLVYKFASFRYFERGEHHVSRFCLDNVLLLVFGGVLRFSEDGEEIEVRAGEYYIQRKNLYQGGAYASDEPKYFYVHFEAEWSEESDAFPSRGRFDYAELETIITRMDDAEHRQCTQAERQYLFLKLLLKLKEKPLGNRTADRLSEYIESNLDKISSLSDICEAFHYSQNYVIRTFKKEFGISPIQYINEIKIKRAMYLLETTSRPVGEIAYECGFSDYPYFYKRFVRRTGLSPMRWRRQVHQNPLSRK